MKKIISILALSFLVQFSFGQIETRPYWEVGIGGDYVDLPLSPASNYSHSQIIYYPEDLQFRGYINKISFFSVFSGPSSSGTPVDPADFTLKFALTSVNEFDNNQSFIPDTAFTEMTNVISSSSGYEGSYTFDTPFYYDGVQNLVIDFQDLNPVSNGTATDGFIGVENFGNPPKRTIISRTTIHNDNTTSTSVVKQNAYPQTKFYGALERCAWVSAFNHENITNNSADIFLNTNETVVSAIRYNLTEYGDPIPNTYQTTTDRILYLNGLLPAQKYSIHLKSDCDELYSPYRSFSFKTRPTILTTPHTINFDANFQRDYNLIAPSILGIELSNEAGNNSLNGIKMYGKSYPGYFQWRNAVGEPFRENPSFIRKISLDVDLTQNTTNPILKLDILQHRSFFRMRVSDFGNDYQNGGIVEDYVYENITLTDTNFRTIVFDLSDYVGRKVTLNLEHVSKSYVTFTKIDNIELLENDCVFEPILNTTISTDSFDINWNSNVLNHDILITDHDELPEMNNFTSINLAEHNFTNLEIASPYNVYLRKKCVDSNSPWKKHYISTDPIPITVPFYNEMKKNDIRGEFFTINYNKASAISYNDWTGGPVRLHQKITNSQWVGGTTTTEYQAWNENLDFLTTLKFKVDATTLSDLMMDLKFRQRHYYNGSTLTSWFRVLINGAQVGPSYNPTTQASDPVTELNIDLSSYVGNIITVELQQVGKSYNFSTGESSGDGVLMKSVNLTGTDTASITDEITRNEIKLFPNPAFNKLNLIATTLINSVEIYDLTGKKLKDIRFVNPTQNTQFNIENLTKGVYYLVIKSDNKNYKQIFIKK